MSLASRFRYENLIRYAPDDGTAGTGDGGGAGGGGAAAAGAAGEAGAGAAAPFDWKAAGLDDAGVALATTKGWKSPADAIRGYSEVERALGNNIGLPGKDAKEDEWGRLYDKLGRPPSPDKYVLPEANYTEADKQFQAAILPELHKAGMTQRQIDAIVPVWNGLQQQQIAALDERAAQQPDTCRAELLKSYGSDEKVKEALDFANRAYRTVFGKELETMNNMRLADGTYLGDNPLFARAFAALGEKLGEGGLLVGDPPPGGGAAGAGDAKRALDAILDAAAKDPKHAYLDPKHPEHGKVQDEVMRLTTLVAQGGQSATA